jgi:hypothetical protein
MICQITSSCCISCASACSLPRKFLVLRSLSPYPLAGLRRIAQEESVSAMACSLSLCLVSVCELNPKAQACRRWMYVRTYVCAYFYMYVCLCVCLYVRMFVPMSVCTYVCAYFCMYVCMFVCMYVYMHVCMHVCMRLYVCMLVS